MQVLDATEVRNHTPWRPLIDSIGRELRTGRSVAPERHVHPLPQPGGESGSLLLMPSWSDGDLIAVKVVTYFPSNAARNLATINAAVLLFDGVTGAALATLDGDELTARRTAATSALAATYLAREDATRLLVVGTGQLAPNMAKAYAQVRGIEVVEVWGRDPAKAERVAASLAEEGLPARPAEDLAASVAAADIVSCVTGATEPLIAGDWLTPGTHLDLVGSFRPDMRESDDAAVARADVFVDTLAGATQAGDLAQPIADGVLSEDDIAADLRQLVDGEHAGRGSSQQVTLFKSAGSAMADLAAARLAWRGPDA